VIKAKGAPYRKRGKPSRRPELLNEDDATIIGVYGPEHRGIVNYYLLAHDIRRLNRLHWVMETSMLKTLAGKHKSTVAKMARRYKRVIDTPDGPRTGFEAAAARVRDGRPRVARFGGIPLKRQRGTVIRPARRPGRPPQAADHPAADRHLRDLRQHPGHPGPSGAQARRPQPAGTATTSMGTVHGQTAAQDPRGLRSLSRQDPRPSASRDNHDIVAGEPDARKRARPVREEAAAEKDQFTWHLARRPTSPTSAQPGMTLGVLFSYSPNGCSAAIRTGCPTTGHSDPDNQFTNTLGEFVTLVSRTGPNVAEKNAGPRHAELLPAALVNFCFENATVLPVFEAAPARLAAL
jgi:hypothetical protein